MAKGFLAACSHGGVSEATTGIEIELDFASITTGKGMQMDLDGLTTGIGIEILIHDSTMTTGKAIYVESTSVDTSGSSVRPIHMVHTMSGAGGCGGRAEFQMTASAALGGWANALKGYTDITTTTGSVSGLGSGICAELRLPGSALSIGSYAVLEIELVTQASGSYTAPTSFIWCQVSGDQTATDTWDDTGYFFTIKGLTDAAGNVFDTNTTPTCDATLRCLIGSTPYYVLLSSSPTS